MKHLDRDTLKTLILEVLDEARSFRESESDRDLESMKISVPALIRDISDAFNDRLYAVGNNRDALYNFGVMLDEMRQHVENYMRENPVSQSAPAEDDEF
jgi:hypothetical protein